MKLQLKRIIWLPVVIVLLTGACKKDKTDDNGDNANETPQPCGGVATVTDAENNSYNTVAIGNQCWLKENLKLGTKIDGQTTPTNNNVIEKYCYNDDVANCNQFGGLYAWNEVMKYSNAEGSQGICPSGWHIPKRSEIEALTAQSGVNGLTLQSTNNGSGATNASGFSALLAGQRLFSGDFDGLNNKTDIWTSTEYSSNSYAYSMSIIKAGSSIDKTFFSKALGFSVRCIKNS